jgi:hypothetical protein
MVERSEMRIELARTSIAREMGVVDCGLCGREFTVGVVRAEIVTDGDHEGGLACPVCVEALSNTVTVEDGRFPSPGKVRALETCWRTPEFESVEELEAAEQALG